MIHLCLVIIAAAASPPADPPAPRPSAVLELRDLGIDGTGLREVGGVIQNALQSAPEGAEIKFQAGGQYKISSPVKISRRLKLTGNGATVTVGNNHAFMLTRAADISGFHFVSTSTGTAVPAAVYGDTPEVSGTSFHDNTLGRLIVVLRDGSPNDGIPNAAGLWVFRNTFNGDYTNAVAGDTYNLLDLRGWNDLWVWGNHFEVVNEERFVKVSGSSRRVHIVDNSFVSKSGTNGKQAIDLFADTREVIIANNIFDLSGRETACAENKNGDNNVTHAEPSEMMIVNNLCKLSSASPTVEGFALFGAWGLGSQTLARNTAIVSGNLVLASVAKSSGALILVRGFTSASVHDNVVWRDTASTPAYTASVEVSNSRQTTITDNQIEYGFILVNGAASHPNSTVYSKSPESVLIRGNHLRSHKNFGSVTVSSATVGDMIVEANVFTAPPGGDVGGFVSLSKSRVARGVIANNSGATEAPTDVALSDSTVESWSMAGNSWQSARTVWEPGAIASGASATTTVHVLGAQPGDVVEVGAPYDLQGCIASGRISAPGTVSISLLNPGSSKKLGSGTFQVAVSRH